jgi:hypothetical protein
MKRIDALSKDTGQYRAGLARQKTTADVAPPLRRFDIDYTEFLTVQLGQLQSPSKDERLELYRSASEVLVKLLELSTPPLDGNEWKEEQLAFETAVARLEWRAPTIKITRSDSINPPASTTRHSVWPYYLSGAVGCAVISIGIRWFF